MVRDNGTHLGTRALFLSAQRCRSRHFMVSYFVVHPPSVECFSRNVDRRAVTKLFSWNGVTVFHLLIFLNSIGAIRISYLYVFIPVFAFLGFYFVRSLLALLRTFTIISWGPSTAGPAGSPGEQLQQTDNEATAASRTETACSGVATTNAPLPPSPLPVDSGERVRESGRLFSMSRVFFHVQEATGFPTVVP